VAVGAEDARAGARDALDRPRPRVPEPVAHPGGDERDLRTDCLQERRATASVRAVVRNDECLRPERRTPREERRLAGGLEIARQERARPFGGRDAQDEAPVVDRAPPIRVVRMGHLQPERSARDPFAPT
jgi:hypothetical protein